MANDEHELQILQEIERNPATTQADLAAQLGLAVGSINWYVKRLITKGYVKVTHLQRRKLHYFLTPSGLALKVKLTRSYMDVSLRVYRELRQSAQSVLTQVNRAGYNSIYIDGNDEATEILRLTCLDQGIQITARSMQVPLLRAEGTSFVVTLPVPSEKK